MAKDSDVETSDDVGEKKHEKSWAGKLVKGLKSEVKGLKKTGVKVKKEAIKVGKTAGKTISKGIQKVKGDNKDSGAGKSEESGAEDDDEAAAAGDDEDDDAKDATN